MPTPFGKYVLQRKLAEGGMAEVFLAKQGGVEGFEKLVVIKRILPQLLAEPEFVKMFINEARLAARLNHPNVVQIFDLGQIEKLYFIAMEFVHGEDLRSLVLEANHSGVRPPQGLVCRILADTLAGLHYAHTRVSPDGRPLGLVHRDVSPQNVLVTYEGSVKLVDFGIAKATRATSEQTQAGLFKGKFSYMAPEQTRGQPIDARADVFAVGILLWEMLTWRRLFKRATEMATLIAVSEDPIPTPASLRPDVPPELDRIVMRALARPLSERYTNAQEMRADLEALIRAQSWEADALALERFMRGVFAQKLEAQEADVRAAGLASLDDFLLTVEEGTKVSWMPERQGQQRTPSAGLPTAPSLLPPTDGAPPLYGNETKPTEVMPPDALRERVSTAASSFSGQITSPRTRTDDTPVTPVEDRPLPGVVARSPSSAADTLKPGVMLASPPPAPPPRSSTSSQRNLTPPPARGLTPAPHPAAAANVAPRSPSSSQRNLTPPPARGLTPAPMAVGAPPRVATPNPTALPAVSAAARAEWAEGALPPTVAAPPPATSARGEWNSDAPTVAAPAGVSDSTRQQPAYDPRSTAKQPSYDPPSRWRRVIVIGSAATVVAGIALIAALWSPSEATVPVPVPTPTPTPTPVADPPAPKPPVRPAPATLEIQLDVPAVISIDGVAEPLARAATVTVQPGVAHLVAVQRPGHSVHTFHIAALASAEHQRISLKVK